MRPTPAQLTAGARGPLFARRTPAYMAFPPLLFRARLVPQANEKPRSGSFSVAKHKIKVRQRGLVLGALPRLGHRVQAKQDGTEAQAAELGVQQGGLAKIQHGVAPG